MRHPQNDENLHLHLEVRSKPVGESSPQAVVAGSPWTDRWSDSRTAIPASLTCPTGHPNPDDAPCSPAATGVLFDYIRIPARLGNVRMCLSPLACRWWPSLRFYTLANLSSWHVRRAPCQETVVAVETGGPGMMAGSHNGIKAAATLPSGRGSRSTSSRLMTKPCQTTLWRMLSWE